MFENIQVPSELIPSDPRFGAGPSLVPTEHLARLAETGSSFMGTSHRKSGVKSVVAELQRGLKNYFNCPDDYEVHLGNGGATLLFDMIGLGLVKDQSAHFTCGEFSNKWFKSHAAIPWIEAREFSASFGTAILPHNDFGDAICCTLNETSTGVANTALPQRQDGQVILVDATSGAGQVECQLDKADLSFFSPQKVFAADGGLWVAIASPRLHERALSIDKNTNNYIPPIMSWKLAIDNGLKNQTYNTPSLATIFLLNEQVKKMNEVGYEKIVSDSRQKAQIVYAWAEEKPYLSCYVENPTHRSSVVATIDVDEKVDVDALTKMLREKKLVYDIEAYRKLGRNQMRIGLFYNVSAEDTEKLTRLISYVIESELK